MLLNDIVRWYPVEHLIRVDKGTHYVGVFFMRNVREYLA